MKQKLKHSLLVLDEYDESQVTKTIKIKDSSKETVNRAIFNLIEEQGYYIGDYRYNNRYPKVKVISSIEEKTISLKPMLKEKAKLEDLRQKEEDKKYQLEQEKRELELYNQLHKKFGQSCKISS